MKSTRILSLLLCLALLAAAVFTLGACNLDDLEITGEGKYEFTADGKQDSVDLLISFFDGTVQNVEEGEVAEEVNFVVTIVTDNKSTLVETVKGEEESIRMDFGGNTTEYLFKSGDEYIVAVESDTANYYMTGKDAYDTLRFTFLNMLRKASELEEKEGATFDCISVMEDSDYITKDVQETHSTAELNFDYKSDDGSVHITANAKDGFVQNCTITEKLNDRESVTTMTFVYGNASVTLPDITDWPVRDANED